MSDTLLLTVRVVFSLALVLALVWFLARRMGAGQGVARRVPITVLGRQTLGRRAGVAIIDVAGRTLVLGVSDTGVRLLTELEAGPFQLEGEEPEAGTPTAVAASSTAQRPALGPATWRTSWEMLRNRAQR